MAGKRKFFEEKHNDYLIDCYYKQDQILATELSSLFEEPFTTEDVKHQRAELKLPPPDREKALAAGVMPSRKPAEPAIAKSDAPLSAAQAMKSPKPKAHKPIRNNFQVVSDEVQGKLDKLLAEKRASSDFVFEPVYVTKPEKGKAYFYPGIGPVTCGGIQTIPVAGMDMKTVSFSEIFTTGAKKVLRFDPAKIKQKFIRELATAEVLNDAVRKLAGGKGALSGLPRHATQQKAFFEKILVSPNLADVVALLSHTFNSDKGIGKRGSLEITFGNLSLDLIAAEYAQVKNIPWDDAKDLLKRAVGKPTIEQLKEYNDGKMRGGPA